MGAWQARPAGEARDPDRHRGTLSMPAQPTGAWHSTPNTLRGLRSPRSPVLRLMERDSRILATGTVTEPSLMAFLPVALYT
jgi:hypothetical protein